MPRKRADNFAPSLQVAGKKINLFTLNLINGTSQINNNNIDDLNLNFISSEQNICVISLRMECCGSKM